MLVSAIKLHSKNYDVFSVQKLHTLYCEKRNFIVLSTIEEILEHRIFFDYSNRNWIPSEKETSSAIYSWILLWLLLFEIFDRNRTKHPFLHVQCNILHVMNIKRSRELGNNKIFIEIFVSLVNYKYYVLLCN